MVKSNTVTPQDRQIAVVLAAVLVGLLFRSVPLDLLPGDAGEFQFAAWTFGLAHATGYPLYLIVGGLWQHFWALFGVAPAASLNLLSAVFAGAAVAMFYLLLVRWMPGPVVSRRLAAALGAAFLAANPTFRSQALQAEVYTLHVVLLIAILWAAQRIVLADDDPDDPVRGVAGRFALLAFLCGLGLTHHAMTLLIAPALLAYLFAWRRDWWRNRLAWLWAIPAGIAPLLLYVYVPLRSGPDASPWYHQQLGAGVLTLLDNSPAALFDFITGRSISVGFHSLETALAAAPSVLVLWLRHFEWTGLVLIIVGVYVLVRMRNWPVLALTGVYFVLQLLFNLFYAIGDIFVYYIPLYLIACIWIGFAGAGIGSGFSLSSANAAQSGPRAWGVPLLVLLFVLPVQLWANYTTMLDMLKSDSVVARQQWEQLLGDAPAENAILVSNDRNEIVPLFYLQHVEGRGRGFTGLFPLIAPGERFADIGATIQTALDVAGEQPVFLIKPMPGLETRFALEERTPLLVEVTGPAVTAAPAIVVDRPYGPLHMVGYKWAPAEDGVEVEVIWSVSEQLPEKYTTTVQLFNAAGEKIGQDDRQTGGDFYPTVLWKPGELLVDRHFIPLPDGDAPARMLVAMYAGPDAVLLAEPVEVAVDGLGD